MFRQRIALVFASALLFWPAVGLLQQPAAPAGPSGQPAIKWNEEQIIGQFVKAGLLYDSSMMGADDLSGVAVDLDCGATPLVRRARGRVGSP